MIIERHYNLYCIYMRMISIAIIILCLNIFMIFFLNHCEKIKLKEKINPLVKNGIKEGIIIS